MNRIYTLTFLLALQSSALMAMEKSDNSKATPPATPTSPNPLRIVTSSSNSRPASPRTRLQQEAARQKLDLADFGAPHVTSSDSMKALAAIQHQSAPQLTTTSSASTESQGQNSGNSNNN